MQWKILDLIQNNILDLFILQAIVFLCVMAMSQAYVYYGLPNYPTRTIYNVAAAPVVANA